MSPTYVRKILYMQTQIYALVTFLLNSHIFFNKCWCHRALLNARLCEYLTGK